MEIRDAQRSATSDPQITERIQHLQLIHNSGMARNAAELSKNLAAITNLPLGFLEHHFDLRYLPEFRVAGPRNPVGCWFQSYGQGGGLSSEKPSGGGWVEHRKTTKGSTGKRCPYQREQTLLDGGGRRTTSSISTANLGTMISTDFPHAQGTTY